MRKGSDAQACPLMTMRSMSIVNRGGDLLH
jgi:hypothetical protein